MSPPYKADYVLEAVRGALQWQVSRHKPCLANVCEHCKAWSSQRPSQRPWSNSLQLVYINLLNHHWKRWIYPLKCIVVFRTWRSGFSGKIQQNATLTNVKMPAIAPSPQNAFADLHHWCSSYPKAADNKSQLGGNLFCPRRSRVAHRHKRTGKLHVTHAVLGSIASSVSRGSYAGLYSSKLQPRGAAKSMVPKKHI